MGKYADAYLAIPMPISSLMADRVMAGAASIMAGFPHPHGGD